MTEIHRGIQTVTIDNVEYNWKPVGEVTTVPVRNIDYQVALVVNGRAEYIIGVSSPRRQDNGAVTFPYFVHTTEARHAYENGTAEVEVVKVRMVRRPA